MPVEESLGASCSPFCNCVDHVCHPSQTTKLRHSEKQQGINNLHVKNLFSNDKSRFLPDSPLGAFSTCTTRCDDRAARGGGCVLPRRTNWRQARSWRHISGALSSMRDRVQDVLPARKRRVRTVFLAVAPVDHKRAEQMDRMS